MPSINEQVFVQMVREFVEEVSREGVQRVASRGANKLTETAMKGASKGLASGTLDYMLRNPKRVKEILGQIFEESLKSSTHSSTSGGILLWDMVEEVVRKSFEVLFRVGGKGPGGNLPLPSAGLSLKKVADAGTKTGGIPHLGYIFDGVLLMYFITRDVSSYRDGTLSRRDLISNTKDNVSSTIGGAIGACIGQTLTPIPVVGGVIGGVVGGYAGSYFCAKYSRMSRGGTAKS